MREQLVFTEVNGRYIREIDLVSSTYLRGLNEKSVNVFYYQSESGLGYRSDTILALVREYLGDKKYFSSYIATPLLLNILAPYLRAGQDNRGRYVDIDGVRIYDDFHLIGRNGRVVSKYQTSGIGGLVANLTIGGIVFQLCGFTLCYLLFYNDESRLNFLVSPRKAYLPVGKRETGTAEDLIIEDLILSSDLKGLLTKLDELNLLLSGNISYSTLVPQDDIKIDFSSLGVSLPSSITSEGFDFSVSSLNKSSGLNTDHVVGSVISSKKTKVGGGSQKLKSVPRVLVQFDKTLAEDLLRLGTTAENIERAPDGSLAYFVMLHAKSWELDPILKRAKLRYGVEVFSSEVFLSLFNLGFSCRNLPTADDVIFMYRCLAYLKVRNNNPRDLSFCMVCKFFEREYARLVREYRAGVLPDTEFWKYDLMTAIKYKPLNSKWVWRDGYVDRKRRRRKKSVKTS